MLAGLRTPRIGRVLSKNAARSLAIVQGSVPAVFNNQNDDSTPSGSQRVRVDPGHGLFHFFRKKEINGSVRYETVETPDLKITGRSWTAPELRRKSFSDLHTLWYVVLRERNLLATQKEEARRLGVTNPIAYTSQRKVLQCRKTMARIKYVLNERRLAYEGAVNIVAQQRAEEEVKAASSAEELREAEKIKAREAALEKLRRASAYRRRKLLFDADEKSRHPGTESGESPSVVSVAANLFPSDRSPSR